MATQTQIAIKHSGTTGNTPALIDLAYGELAINYADGKIYYKTASDTLGSIYTIVIPGIDKDVIFNDGGSLGSSAGLTFDKATANLAVANTVTTSVINQNNISLTGVGTYTTSNTNQVVVDTFSLSTYRTAKYVMQLTSDSNYHAEDITIIHNGTTPRIVEYGVVFSDGLSLGSFDVDIVGSEVHLLFTPVNNVTTLKFNRTLLTV